MTHRRDPLWNIWNQMKQRCFNPRNAAWPDYGGRGITVCARWRDSLAHFKEDMGPRPLGCSIGRIDNNGNYEPGNCRWADQSTQSRNARVRRTNKLGIAGVHWCEAHRRYQTYINDAAGRRYLGEVGDFFEACCRRKAAEARRANREGVSVRTVC